MLLMDLFFSSYYVITGVHFVKEFLITLFDQQLYGWRTGADQIVQYGFYAF